MRGFYNEDYMMAYIRACVANSAYATCSNFTAEDYYLHRQRAESALLTNLKLDLDFGLQETVPALITDDSATPPVRVSQLQLTNVDFPAEYNTIIQTKLQTQVQQTASLNNRASLLTAANTALIVARQQAAIVIINGDQQATVILSQANATQQVVVDQWRARALSFQAVQTNLGFSDEQSLLQYWQAEPVRVNPHSILVQ